MNFESPFADVVGKKKNGNRARFEISLDPYTDKDILKWLELAPNKSEYIRELIRKDMKSR